MKRTMLVLLGAGLFLLAPLLEARAQALLIPKDRRLPPLAIEYQRVAVKIRDRAALTKITQVFRNHTSRILEATYIFPVPPGASVSGFAMWMNGKKVKGQVLERRRAAAIYHSIVRRLRDPGLVEYIGRNLFRARVFPIPARGRQKIEISFTQVNPYVAGVMRYVYPLKTPGRSARTLRDFTLTVDLKTGAPLKSVYSPSHRVSVARRGEHRATVGFEQERARLNKNFVLFYTASRKKIGISILTYREPGKPGYFMLMATPKTTWAAKEIPSKNIVFVVDTSGSMGGAKMVRARAALRYCVSKLNSRDYFNVIRFSTTVERLSRRMIPASQANIRGALRFVRGLQATGGTAINEALRVALRQKARGAGPRIVVFITDGRPTIGETNPRRIMGNAVRWNKRGAKIFTFGIGHSLNTRLLDGLASAHRGAAAYAKPNREIELVLSSFYDKVRYPVLADLDLAVPRMRVYDTFPRRLPDLFRGSQLLVLGRYRSSGEAAIVLKGLVGDSRKRFVYEAGFPKKTGGDNEFIARLWALRKIGYLLEAIKLKGENPELRTEVIRLARKFGVVTPYTSYLAVERRDRWRLSRRGRRRRMLLARRRRLIRARRLRVRRPSMMMPSRARRRSRRSLWDRLAFWRRTGSRSRAAQKAEPARPTSSGPAPAPPATAARPRKGGFDRPSPVAGGGHGRAKRKAGTRSFRPSPRPAARPRTLARLRLRDVSGRRAVDASKALRQLKDSKTERESASAGVRRYVRGRLFQLRSGVWRDSRFRAGMKVLKIKWMGAAYIRLLTLRPDLKRILALGDRVLIVVAKGRAIEVGPTGANKIPVSKLSSWVRK